MKLGSIKKILKEDLAKAAKDLPAWLDTLLNPLNEFIEKVGLALQNKLTFEDNFYCILRVLAIDSGVAQEVNAKAAFAPNARCYGLLILSSQGQTVSNYSWDQLSNGNISVTITFLSATDAKCEVLLLLR